MKVVPVFGNHRGTTRLTAGPAGGSQRGALSRRESPTGTTWLLGGSRVPEPLDEGLAMTRPIKTSERRSLDEALRDPAFLDGLADLVVEVGPSTKLCPAAHWSCPCGSEPPRPGRATPVATLFSLREPSCPFCGRPFRDEYRRDAGWPA